MVRSWLLELLENALVAGPDPLKGIRGWVEDSGEERWTVQASIDQNVPGSDHHSLSLQARFRSRQEGRVVRLRKILAALRNQFGGHAVTLESGQQGLETETPAP